MGEGSVPARAHGVLLSYRYLLILENKYSGITINVNLIPCIPGISALIRVNGNLGA